MTTFFNIEKLNTNIHISLHKISYVNKILFYRFLDVCVDGKLISSNYARVIKKLISYNGVQGCFPSLQTLCEATGYSKMTVCRALAVAREAGWIDWTNERTENGQRLSVNHYWVTITCKAMNDIIKRHGRIKGLVTKMAEVSHSLLVNQVARSSYYYINKLRLKRWLNKNHVKKIEEASLSPFQRLFKENPQLALQQLLGT